MRQNAWVPRLLSRTSVLGLVLALVLIFSASLPEGRSLTLPDLPRPTAEPAPSTAPEQTAPTTEAPRPEILPDEAPEAPESTDGAPAPESESDEPPSTAPPRIVPQVVPPRGSLIEPTQPVPPEPPPAPVSFIDERGSAPARWDPCTPIRYVVRREAGPRDGFELIRTALQSTADSSGLTFQFEGFTSLLYDEYVEQNPENDRNVWIGWAFNDEVPALGPDEDHLGIGGISWQERPGGSKRVLTGQVVLRSDLSLDNSFEAGSTQGNLLLHEIGHMVGLGHSDDRADQMYSYLSVDSPSGWGPGDLAGLYELGSARGCIE